MVLVVGGGLFSGPVWRAETSESIEDRQAGDGAAGQQTGGHAEDERRIALICTVNDPDDLKDAKAAKCNERDALVGFLAPDGDDLRDKEQSVAEQTEAEDDCNDLFHCVTFLGKRSSFRRRALAASSSRSRAGALVSSEARRRADAAAISSIAVVNAGSLAFDGLL